MRENGRRSDKRKIGARTTHGDGVKHIRYVVTLFVDNLPKDMINEWLVQLFEFDARVVDVFVSCKRRRGRSNPFSFV